MFFLAYPLKGLCFGYLWSCVPSQGPEGTLRVRKQPQDTIQGTTNHYVAKHPVTYKGNILEITPHVWKKQNHFLCLVLLAAIQDSRHREDTQLQMQDVDHCGISDSDSEKVIVCRNRKSFVLQKEDFVTEKKHAYSLISVCKVYVCRVY